MNYIEMKKLEDIDDIKLEEMDWQNARTSIVEQIRQNKLSMDLNEQVLLLCNLRLKQLWDLLPLKEQKKRNRLDNAKTTFAKEKIVEVDEETAQKIKEKLMLKEQKFLDEAENEVNQQG